MSNAMEYDQQHPCVAELYEKAIAILTKIKGPSALTPELLLRVRQFTERIAAERHAAAEGNYPFCAVPKTANFPLEAGAEGLVTPIDSSKSVPECEGAGDGASFGQPVGNQLLTNILSVEERLKNKLLDQSSSIELDPKGAGKLIINQAEGREICVNDVRFETSERLVASSPPHELPASELTLLGAPLAESSLHNAEDLTSPPGAYSFDSPFHRDKRAKPSSKLKGKKKGMPPDGPTFASADKVQSMRKAMLFANEIGKPLNSFLTISLRDHEDYNPQAFGEVREKLRKMLLYAWKTSGAGKPFSISCFENDERGGLGLHTHILNHIPGDRAEYTAIVKEITRIMAPNFSKAIDALFTKILGKLNWGNDATSAKAMALVKKYLGQVLHNAKPAQKYDALRALRAELRRTRSTERAANMIQLPFLIEDDCVNTPLDEHNALKKLRYLCKQVDPKTQVPYNGQMTALADLPEGAVTLAKQSRRRPVSRTLCCSRNLDVAAQARWLEDHKRELPVAEPFDEWFVNPKFRTNPPELSLDLAFMVALAASDIPVIPDREYNASGATLVPVCEISATAA